jgi:hypothetical protein
MTTPSDPSNIDLADDGTGIPRFPATSRYATTPLAALAQPDGQALRYLRRRFLPDPARFAVVQTYRVLQGDRMDRMATNVLGDPEAFWRLADANGCIAPDELEQPQRRIVLTLPQDMAGPTESS